ncbi:Ras-related protein RABA5e [Diplonema papillatum]|nr:Ras-related protein RABA5e [Diplonema papillatum]
MTIDVASEEYVFKLVLIGDSGVGKSSLMTRYTVDEFSTGAIGLEFMTKRMKFETRDVKVQVWDSVGQERFGRAIPRFIYHGAKGAMLVYDITNQVCTTVHHEGRGLRFRRLPRFTWSMVA